MNEETKPSYEALEEAYNSLLRSTSEGSRLQLNGRDPEDLSKEELIMAIESVGYQLQEAIQEVRLERSRTNDRIEGIKEDNKVLQNQANQAIDDILVAQKFGLCAICKEDPKNFGRCNGTCTQFRWRGVRKLHNQYCTCRMEPGTRITIDGFVDYPVCNVRTHRVFHNATVYEGFCKDCGDPFVSIQLQDDPETMIEYQ